MGEEKQFKQRMKELVQAPPPKGIKDRKHEGGEVYFYLRVFSHYLIRF
jgi:hypothetical protein